MSEKPHSIVVGQAVSRTKLQAAKELRLHQTRSEQVLWDALRAHKLRGLHFRRQQVIDGLIMDFYCHAVSLVIEVDGASHAGRVEDDMERDRFLSSRGLCIIHVTDEDVINDLSGVLDRILVAAGRVTYPPAPFPARERGPILPSPCRGGAGERLFAAQKRLRKKSQQTAA